MEGNTEYKGIKYDRVTHADFGVSMVRALVFIPAMQAPISQIIRKLPERWFERFTEDPLTIPLPEGAPQEIPRLHLRDTNDEKRFRLSMQRFDFELVSQNLEEDRINLYTFYTEAIDYIKEFIELFNLKIIRLAINMHRFVKHNDPGLYLAQHFCREEWWFEAPMNRPKHYEINTHKMFNIYDDLFVNSWVRNKAGRILSTDEPIVLVEQDINTLKEDVDIRKFEFEDVEKFLKNVPIELDYILKLYYPELKED